mmetsp:Transcript_29296/g.49909  ORF Transcript_29296/g.49909 Transcript_29296/m.49909 type:complete len:646 (-) Transcript_29296:999-2936(-)
MRSNSLLTAQVYECICDGDYAKAIDFLQSKLGDFPRSRPLLSLIAYCCYHNQDFSRAAEFYETLTELCPESVEYQVNYVQSLVKGGSYLDASHITSSVVVESPFQSQMRLLQAHAELEQGMLAACETTLSQCLADDHDDPDTIIALATLDFREGKFAKALELYKIAQQVVGCQPMIAYCIALCHYRLGDFDTALEVVNVTIKERKEDPVGSDGGTFLKESLCLKAAVLYTMKRFERAKDTMKELCELLNNENLDTITVHNDAIINVEEDPSLGIQKLEFLLSNQPFPSETLSNLLTLYTIHGQNDLAAATFEANKSLAHELLLPDDYAYFDAVMMSLACPEDAFSMLETQVANYIPKLKSSKSKLSEAIRSTSEKPAKSAPRPTTDAERTEHRALSVATKELDDILDQYIPVVMLQARLYWERKEYTRAEQVLRRSAEYCHEREAWRMNMGHIMFAQQGDKFEASIEHYEHLLKHHIKTDLLEMPAIALANLCVAYIMGNQNEEAEEVISAVEKEEQHQVGGRTCHTSCIINLIIGTLYCEKGNYEFGVGRVVKSMEPFEKNLCPDTWHYTKRVFLHIANKISKVMYVINDDTLHDVLCFFDDIGNNGKHISVDSDGARKEPVTIASEAKLLKDMFIKICIPKGS